MQLDKVILDMTRWLIHFYLLNELAFLIMEDHIILPMPGMNVFEVQKDLF